jgi:hypothetical protein
MQVTSKRVANAKSERYHGNILKRGKVELNKVLGTCCAAPTASRRCAPAAASTSSMQAQLTSHTACKSCRKLRSWAWGPYCWASSSLWSWGQVRIIPITVERLRGTVAHTY